MKQFYGLLWLVLGTVALISVSMGAINPVGLVAFSLVVLGLVYAFALWWIIVNARDARTE